MKPIDLKTFNSLANRYSDIVNTIDNIKKDPNAIIGLVKPIHSFFVSRDGALPVDKARLLAFLQSEIEALTLELKAFGIVPVEIKESGTTDPVQ